SLRQGGASGEHEAEAAAARILMAEQHFLRGEQALRPGQMAAAVTELDRAEELGPDEAKHPALLAWARWCANEDKDSARPQVKLGFNLTVDLSPKCVPAFFYRGQVAMAMADIDVALDCFRKVLELEPEHRDAGLQVRLIESRMSKGDAGKKKAAGLLDRLKRK